MKHRYFLSLCIATLVFCLSAFSKKDKQFVERNGMVAGEAESFTRQTADAVRKWYVITVQPQTEIPENADGNHAATASGKAYIEILPDTRRTKNDKLITGENFSTEPGKLAVISYSIRIKTPGRYYVWVKAFSTGAEDNGLHVGLDGQWPESGQRMQWCEGKNAWTWASKQRTEKNHCGEQGKIFLDVDKPGMHTLQFSMREDGFEMDKFLLTTDTAFRPEGFTETANAQ